MNGKQVPRSAAVLAAAMLLAGVSTASAATTERFVPTTVHYPGSTSTTARGINNSGDIVGTYACSLAAGCTLTGEEGAAGSHGFLLQDGVYTRIDVPAEGRTANQRAASVSTGSSSDITRLLACNTDSRTGTATTCIRLTCLRSSSTTLIHPLAIPSRCASHLEATLWAVFTKATRS